ncbi:hypothetical protein HWV62_16600 [Athelia sp. TMB]|nr:hypothetical protein HWV62_16600 [Athelia sp. TMB]
MANPVFNTIGEGEIINVANDYYDNRARDITVINPVYHIHLTLSPGRSNREATQAVEEPPTRENTLFQNAPASPEEDELECDSAFTRSPVLDAQQRETGGQQTYEVHQFTLEQDDLTLDVSITAPTPHYPTPTPLVARASYPPVPQSPFQARAVPQHPDLTLEEGYIVLPEDDGTGPEVCALWSSISTLRFDSELLLAKCTLARSNLAFRDSDPPTEAQLADAVLASVWLPAGAEPSATAGTSTDRQVGNSQGLINSQCSLALDRASVRPRTVRETPPSQPASGVSALLSSPNIPQDCKLYTTSRGHRRRPRPRPLRSPPSY